MIRHLLVLVLVALPLAASSQTIPTVGPALELATVPTNPSAGDTVTVRAENVASVGNTTFVWSVDGRVVDQGVGVSAITVTLGGLGTPSTVSVRATEGGVLKGERTLTITPAAVDIVWEGLTYTPPFYSGLPLPNPSSEVRLVAVPHVLAGGVRVSAGTLVYTWYVNSSQAPTLSGYGRNTLTVRPPQFANDFTVRVRVETPDGSVRTEGVATIEPVQPEILFYERAPLLGYTFNRAVVDSYALTEEEVTFGAFPFYVGNLDAPRYGWSLNGASVDETSEGGREVTFRRSGAGSGAFTVAFTLENSRALFERARKNFLLSF